MQAGVGGQAPAGKAARQPRPGLLRRRLDQQRLVGLRPCVRRQRFGLRLAGAGGLPGRAQQMTAQLAQTGARQGIAGERDFGDALIGGQVRVHRRHRLAHGGGDVGVPGVADGARLGQHQAEQPAAVFQQGEFADVGMALIGRLHGLGLHVLAAGGDDEFLGAAGDEQIAAGIQPPQIAGAEPAVGGEGLLRLLRQVAVAREDVRAAYLDLAVRSDAHFHPRQRAADAAGAAHGRVDADERRGLGQAVADRHLPAQSAEFSRQLRFQRRAAAGQQPQFRGELLVQQVAEQCAAGVQPQAVECPRQGHEAAHQGGGRAAARRHPRLDAGQHGGIHARHPHHDRGFAFLQRPQHLRAGERLRQDQRQPQGKRRQQPQHEGIDMVQRQGQRHPVSGDEEAGGAQGLDLEDEIGVGQGHALGHAGGARGVEQDGGLPGRGFGQARSLGHDVPRGRYPLGEAMPALRCVRGGVEQPGRDAGRGAGQTRQLVRGGEHQAGAAVGQYMGQGFLRHLHVQGQRRRPGADGSQGSGDPFRAVRGVDRHRVARIEPRGQPGGQARDVSVQLGAGPGAGAFRGHDDERRPVAVTGHAVDQGHQGFIGGHGAFPVTRACL